MSKKYYFVNYEEFATLEEAMAYKKRCGTKNPIQVRKAYGTGKRAQWNEFNSFEEFLGSFSDFVEFIK